MAYQQMHKTFPTGSTLQQLYDFQEFDAYRELGHFCAQAAVDHIVLTPAAGRRAFRGEDDSGRPGGSRARGCSLRRLVRAPGRPLGWVPGAGTGLPSGRARRRRSSEAWRQDFVLGRLREADRREHSAVGWPGAVVTSVPAGLAG